MKFQRSLWIDRPPVVVFAFLRDKDTHPQEPGSPVVRLERTTPCPVREGTRFLEVVRVLPFLLMRIESEVTRCDPPHRLEERFTSRQMAGYLAYEFRSESGGTNLVQWEMLRYRGLLALAEPVLARLLLPRIESRLRDIRDAVQGR